MIARGRAGLIFDVTGSYQAAFVHGIAWNMLNIALVLLLMWRVKGARRETRRERQVVRRGAVTA